MAESSAATPPVPPAAPDAARRQRLADGIYGTIITASVLASAGDELATLPLVISVLLTLTVYWTADVYAHLLAGPVHHRRLPSWAEAGATFAATWPMVSASFIPLLLVGVAWAVGASAFAASTTGLVGAIVMLTGYAWSACRAAGLRGVRMVAVTSVAAMLGLLMIVLKNVVLIHLH